MQGMGLNNVYTLLGAIHLALIIQVCNTNTDLGQLLQNLLECLMMELGVPNNHFEYDCKKYSHAATHSRMKHLRELCCIGKVTLRNIVPNFKPNQKKNRDLIKCFTNNGFYGLQLAAINNCLIYLQVIHLSDITPGDSRYISKAVYNGEIRKWSTALAYL